MSTRIVVVLGTALCAASLVAGNVCNWMGGNGSLADDNWDVKPVSGNGDTIVFDTTDGQPITVEIPTEDFDVAGVKFANATFLPIATSGVTKPGKITFTGKRLYVSGSAAAGTTVWDQGTDNEYKRGPEVEVSVPLRFKGGRLAISWTTTFNGPVTIDDSGNLRLWWPINYSDAVKNFPPIVFNDVIYGPQATMDFSAGSGGRGSDVSLYGKVTLKSFYLNQGTLGKCTQILYASDNEIGEVYGCYANLTCSAKNALSANTVVSLYNNYGASLVRLYADTVMNCVVHVQDKQNPTKVDEMPRFSGNSSTPVDLTLRSDRNTEGLIIYQDPVSLVWDPLDAYTNTLVDSACTTKGRLEVKGGVVALKGTTSFANLSLLKIHSGAKVMLTDSTAATPFPATMPVQISGTGKLVVPAERTLTVGAVVRKGVAVAAGSYTKATAQWIEGEGTVTVAQATDTYWKAPVDGNWSDATKWTDGVPSASRNACLMVEGADYTVTIDADADASNWPAKTTVINEGGGTTTLKLDRAIDFGQNHVFSFDVGAHLEITANGAWTHKNTSKPSTQKRQVEVLNGASVDVKGALCFTNLFENVVVESHRDTPSTLTVSGSGGLSAFAGDNSIGTLRVLDGGEILVKESGAVKMPGVLPRSPLYQGGGEIRVQDSGSWGGPMATWGTFTSFGSGTTRFTGDALFYSGAGRWDVRPTVEKQDATVYMDGNARYRAGMFLRIGGSASATGRVVYASSNLASDNTIGDYLMLGGQTGGVGEYVVKAGCHYLRSIGLKLGGDRESANSSGVPYRGDGHFVMEGGTFSVRNLWATAKNQQEYISGVLVGTCPYYSGYETPLRKGVLDVKDGFFEVRDGFFIVGERNAEGRVRQTGGRVENGVGLSVENRLKVPLIVGFGGGSGTYELADGVVTNYAMCYLGGAKCENLLTTTWPTTFTVHENASTGVVSICGGDFCQKNAMVVGEDGSGTLEVRGSAARIDISSLELRDGAASTVKFVCDADGVSAVKVGGDLSIAAGAKLVVDATAYARDGRSVTLFTFGACADEFTDVDIIGGDSTAYVRKTATKMVFHPSRKGLMLLVR